MRVIYYDGSGKEFSFERDTLDDCVREYYRRRNSGHYGYVGWGHVYIDGERVWL